MRLTRLLPLLAALPTVTNAELAVKGAQRVLLVDCITQVPRQEVQLQYVDREQVPRQEVQLQYVDREIPVVRTEAREQLVQVPQVLYEAPAVRADEPPPARMAGSTVYGGGAVYGGSTAQAGQGLFSTLDGNHDGVISRAEFDGGNAAGAPAPPRRARLRGVGYSGGSLAASAGQVQAFPTNTLEYPGRVNEPVYQQQAGSIAGGASSGQVQALPASTAEYPGRVTEPVYQQQAGSIAGGYARPSGSAATGSVQPLTINEPVYQQQAGSIAGGYARLWGLAAVGSVQPIAMSRVVVGGQVVAEPMVAAQEQSVAGGYAGLPNSAIAPAQPLALYGSGGYIDGMTGVMQASYGYH